MTKMMRTTRTLVNAPVDFDSPITFTELPETPVEEIQKADLTPSVLNLTKLRFINTVSTTVTNFRDAQEGQVIHVLGDGFTTLANNANIQTRTGANRLLTNGLLYIFGYFDSKWRETA